MGRSAPGRFRLRPGRTLREHTARGAAINAVFLVGVNTINVARGFVVVAFLTPAEFGLWGVLTVSMGLVLWLKQVGIADGYVQQDEADQELAFQRAFTLEVLLTAIFTVVLAAAVPLIALIYGEHALLAPGFVALLVMPALALQSPLWVFYRRLDFLKQRLLQTVEPIVTTIVSIALAAAGAGYWALLAGVIAGAWSAAAAAVWASPFKLRWRFDRAALGRYTRFSWPLLAATMADMVVAFGAVFLGQAKLGLAGVGAITLASTVTQYADRLDQVVTQTMYPAICAVRDQTELLRDAFIKSNRLALMWGAPFGFGVALFAPDLVHFVLGDRWTSAIGLLQAFGVLAALNHVAFNWGAFYRARGETRPAAVVSVVLLVSFCVAVIPGLLLFELRGLAAGMGIVVAAAMAARVHYVRRLFPGFAVVRFALRGLLPCAPAAALVGLLRLAETGGRSLPLALAELALFVGACLAATWWLERPLLREAFGYLRGRRATAYAA